MANLVNRKSTDIHTQLFAAVTAMLKDINGQLRPGLVLRLFEGHRSVARQLTLYKQGRSKTLRSKHVIWPARACDLVFFENGEWSWSASHPWHLIGPAARQRGLLWGGNWPTFRDYPHVELKG